MTTATDTSPDYRTITERQQRAWEAGDVARVGSLAILHGELLCEALDIHPGERVLDVGAGNGAAALAAARRGADVTATDFVEHLLHSAERIAEIHGLRLRTHVADAQALPFPDDSFDVVIAEAVTMFVDRERATRELARVLRPGGRLLATEFFWRRPPSDEAREIFLGQVCPGMRFDTVEDWVRIYAAAGLGDLHTDTGRFEMMTARGFLADEGVLRSMRIMATVASRAAHVRKMAWLMPRMARAVPYLGYIIVAGCKPQHTHADAEVPAVQATTA
jgi:SAM-dependent methyltransferase